MTVDIFISDDILDRNIDQLDRETPRFVKVFLHFSLIVKMARKSTLKGVQRPAAFAVICVLNFVQSDILEVVESKSLTSRKACWSLYSL